MLFCAIPGDRHESVQLPITMGLRVTSHIQGNRWLRRRACCDRDIKATVSWMCLTRRAQIGVVIDDVLPGDRSSSEAAHFVCV